MQESFLLAKKAALVGSAFSPTMKGSGVTLSLNNTRATITPLGDSVFGAVARSTGKWYFEMVATQFEGSVQYSPLIGLASSRTTYNSPWTSNGEILWYCSGASSTIIYGGNVRFNYGSAFTQGDTIGVAVDLTNRIMSFYRNGTNQGNININTYSTDSPLYPCASSPHGSVGQTVVDWTPTPKYMPAGYSPW